MKLGRLTVTKYSAQKLIYRRDLNTKVLSGEISYRDSFASMLKSVKLPFPKCAELLRDSKLLLSY
jgi:2-hydroxy-3-keto-5-methylthiopentenyl-1-phosphate phosphatase